MQWSMHSGSTIIHPALQIVSVWGSRGEAPPCFSEIMGFAFPLFWGVKISVFRGWFWLRLWKGRAPLLKLTVFAFQKLLLKESSTFFNYFIIFLRSDLLHRFGHSVVLTDQKGTLQHNDCRCADTVWSGPRPHTPLQMLSFSFRQLWMCPTLPSYLVPLHLQLIRPQRAVSRSPSGVSSPSCADGLICVQ